MPKWCNARPLWRRQLPFACSGLSSLFSRTSTLVFQFLLIEERDECVGIAATVPDDVHSGQRDRGGPRVAGERTQLLRGTPGEAWPCPTGTIRSRRGSSLS